MKLTTTQLIGLGIIACLVAGGLGGIIGANIATPDQTSEETAITLIADITGYIGQGGDIDGKINPTLEVTPGTTLTIILKAGQEIAHNLKIDKLGILSDFVAQNSEKYDDQVTLQFTVPAGQYVYYCSVPGHSSLMRGEITTGQSNSLSSAKDVDVSQISRDPKDTGTQVGTRTTPKNVEFTMVVREVVAEIENGTTFTYWTYNGTVPGPMLRAMVGDNITIHLVNPSSSEMAHSIDLHAVTYTGGGSAILKANPGETANFTFVALHDGVFIYHCASPHIPAHISKGMYGSIVIEPKGGLPSVDVELYIGQNEVYTTQKMGTAGHQEYVEQKEYDENPTYVLFNGAAFYFTGDNAIQIPQNSTVRIFFVVGGPNLSSAFHMIGEQWDRVWYETNYTSGPNMYSAETVSVPPGSALMTELTMSVLGSYLVVDHALSRVFDKGCLMQIDVV